MSSGKASPQSLLQGLKKMKRGRTTNLRYAAEEGGGGGGEAGRGRGGGVPRGQTEEVHCIFHSSYAWSLFFNMCLNCFPFPIAGVRGRGRGRGRDTILLSDIPSASGDVAS